MLLAAKSERDGGYFISGVALRRSMHSTGVAPLSLRTVSFCRSIVAMWGKMRRKASSDSILSQAISVMAPSPRVIEVPSSLYVPEIELQLVMI